jgi:hypothetical protein
MPTAKEGKVRKHVRRKIHKFEQHYAVPPKAASGEGSRRPDRKIEVSEAHHSEMMTIPGNAKDWSSKEGQLLSDYWRCKYRSGERVQKMLTKYLMIPLMDKIARRNSNQKERRVLPIARPPVDSNTLLLPWANPNK